MEKNCALDPVWRGKMGIFIDCSFIKLRRRDLEVTFIDFVFQHVQSVIIQKRYVYHIGLLILVVFLKAVHRMTYIGYINLNGSILPCVCMLHFRRVDSTLTCTVSNVLLITLITEFCASS
jgi:hypothetical protein